MARTAQTLAAMRGRAYVLPDDVQLLIVPTLAHRLILSSQARLHGKGVPVVLQNVIEHAVVMLEPGQAVRPEVYALQTALGLGVVYAVVRAESDHDQRWLLVACLVGALGLGNHHLLMLSVLAPAAVVMMTESTNSPSNTRYSPRSSAAAPVKRILAARAIVTVGSRVSRARVESSENKANRRAPSPLRAA